MRLWSRNTAADRAVTADPAHHRLLLSSNLGSVVEKSGAGRNTEWLIAVEQVNYIGQVSQRGKSRASVEVAAEELADMDRLFRNYRGRIYRYALLSLRDPDLAESLTHDCLLRAHNVRAQFRGDCSVMTWLTRIATNLVRDQVRSRKLQFWKTATASAVDPGEVFDRLRAQGPSPEATLLQREQVAGLWRRVDQLSDKQRSVFLLRFVEELELSEIATALGMNLSTVKSHLHRALQAVRSAMDTNAKNGDTR